MRATRLVALAPALFAWLPRLAVPLTATGCQCAERGAPVVFDVATVERAPTIFVEGEACDASDVVCLHRDAKDRCDTFWIEPKREGLCVFSARFPDGTRIENAIEFDADGEYPCRGNVRPRHDQVVRITSGEKT